ncbi:MAG: hypothetical protein WBZ36_14215 [Candidatus Nitrosopolaris sp.]
MRIFLEAGAMVRHVKNLPLMDFAVDNKYFHATIRKEAGRLNQTLLLSNEPAYVEHFKSIFEELWKNGIDATERIKDIDAGANLADVEDFISEMKESDHMALTFNNEIQFKEIVNAFIKRGINYNQMNILLPGHCRH